MALPKDLNIREHSKFRENQSGDTVVAIIQEETPPTDSTKTNASAVYTYTSGNLTKITKTIGSTSYEKTFTYTGDDLTGSTVWSEV